jgi:hypothetical protein
MLSNLFKKDIQKEPLIASVELSKQFINGLKNYEIDFEDIKYNFKYCGGNRGSHLNYFRLSCPNDDIPELVDECVCGHKIIENCYITDGDRLVILGNCCIKKFCDTSNRTCENCGETHRNSKQNRCNNCKIVEKKTTKKLCEKCGASHKNRVVNKCNRCRNGFCDICDKYSNSVRGSYKTCYDCNNKKRVEEINKNKLPNVNYCKTCSKVISNEYINCYKCHINRNYIN